MRYKIEIVYSEDVSINRRWLVKRSNVVGFQLHCEAGPAGEYIRFNKWGNWIIKSYYLRNHQYRNRHTWHNALKYKSYSKNNKGMI